MHNSPMHNSPTHNSPMHHSTAQNPSKHASPARFPAKHQARVLRRIGHLLAPVAVVMALCGLGLAVGVGSAAAAGLELVGIAPSDVGISTDYPVIDVQAGQSVSLDLDLTATATERVALSVTSAPQNWTAQLQGGGFTIGGVYVGPKQTPTVQLHVQVPQDAATGKYHVVVAANSPGGDETLDVELDVVAQASGAYTMTSQFDKLQGSTTATFDFDLTLANNSGKKATFGLTAQGPQGWTVTASPSSQSQASAVEVDAGSTATVSVNAKPPDNVAAGTYPIEVVAQGEGITLQSKLSVQVVGSPTLAVATSDQVLNAAGSAGGTTDVHLVISNTGTAPLQAVSLASSPPSGWKVTFSPSTVESVEPGKSQDVVAHIVPAGNAITGDYQVTLSANSTASSGSVDIRYTVQTSNWWGLVGIVVIVVVIIALLWLFRRFGRR